MRLLFVFIFVFFAGCSFKAQEDVWVKNSSNSFESYSKYFLEGKDRLALVSLENAIHSAKSSADLKPLSKVYLGVCALNIAVLIDDKCESYVNIMDLFDSNDTTVSYYNMLQKRYDLVATEKLPSQYIDFVKATKKRDYNSAIKKIKKMKNVTSMLIASSLIKEHLGSDDIDFLTKKLSFFGYKKAIVRWLKYSKIKNNDEKNKKIDKILHVIK